jgi:prepilin-type N-terminal cleavage/methylation domain-containing protein
MKNRNSGFTLVELLVVALVVGVAVLFLTQIPLFSLSSWRKGSQRLKMQRDAHYATIRIQRKLRPASFTEDPVVSIPDDSTLVIGKDHFYVDKQETSDFFNDFVQESGGNKELIVEGDLGTDFNVIPEGSAIKMTLTLARGNVQTILRTAVKPRN